MAIQEGDVELLKTQVMADVPEGGGRATGVAIADGVSNSIFPDISELDRTIGRVNLRKTVVHVDTADTDSYFGVTVIVADPADDPNVSCTLFSTNDGFDTRDSAQSRIESYLAQGPLIAGLLYSDHIAGQQTVSIIQRQGLQLPSVGETYVLRKNEGLNTLAEQYVRVTRVSSVSRTFTDGTGDFVRDIVTLETSDPLQYDFDGFAATRNDSVIDFTGKTKIYTSIVADAARYYGTVPLKVAATTGDYTISADGIFTQLVPSSRIEVPIADARMNQQKFSLAASGSPLVTTLNALFSSTKSLYIGGSILPGSLSVVGGSTTITDKGGVLLSVGAPVGYIDYENGVLNLTVDLYGTSPVGLTITHVPAATPTVVTDSIGIPVTQQGQRLTWVVDIGTKPAPGSLQVNYRVLGNWYTLTDDGSGAVRGADSSFGVGSLNTTGTLSLTLGALPDVGGQIIISWASTVAVRSLADTPSSASSLNSVFGKIVQTGSAIKPGTILLSWNDGAAKTSTDSAGVLTGDATGEINYATGTIHFCPNALPPVNTSCTVAITEGTQRQELVGLFTSSGTDWTSTLPGPVKARTFEAVVLLSVPFREYPGIDVTSGWYVYIADDGAGALITNNGTSNLTVGSINYTTGAVVLNKTFTGYVIEQPVYVTTQVADTSTGGGGLVAYVTKITQSGFEQRAVTATVLNGSSGALPIKNSPYFTVTGGTSSAAQTRYTGADASGATYTFTFNKVFLPIVAGYFELGGQKFSYPHLSGGAGGTPPYDLNLDPNTGISGTWPGALGVVVAWPKVDNIGKGNVGGVELTGWATGVSPTPTKVRGVSTPAVGSALTQNLIESVTFRTAISPLFNGGFTINGNLADGTAFSVTADTNGLVNSSGVYGKIDYESGVASLRFGSSGGTTGNPGVQNISYLGVTGVTNITSQGVLPDTLRYSAVGYSYIPIDAAILGLNPVRLPSDGRVPIIRKGNVGVIHHKATTTPQTVTNGQTVNVGRVRLSRLRVIGNDGVTIPAGYTVNLDAGTVTFTNVTGYSQPVKIEHRIEDMALVRDAQISGAISFTRPLTHDFPLGSYVSSALVIGDMAARVPLLFDQSTWTDNLWSDTLNGSPATGTYNDVLAPFQVTNAGAITERWIIRFTNTTSFELIGEHAGVIATGTPSVDFAPVNPAAGVPYFRILAAGWGGGWAAGNIVRFNTVGAQFPVWIARTIQQGPATAQDDSFTVLIRGDIDRP